MSRPLSFSGAPETAWTRRVAYAIQVLDAVTLEPVTHKVQLRARGLRAKPVINASRYAVWLAEENRTIGTVEIKPPPGSGLLEVTIPPPAPATTGTPEPILLAPAHDYPFPPGVTALRGTLKVSATAGADPVVGAEIWLQWLDEGHFPPRWTDSTVRSRTNADGDFAVLFRLASGHSAEMQDGKFQARIAATHAGASRSMGIAALTPGLAAAAASPFAWNEFTP